MKSINSKYSHSIILLIVVLLTGCESGLEGSYGDELGMWTFSFNSDGTVTQGAALVDLSENANALELPFEKQGDTITVKIADDAPGFTWTILDDGSILTHEGIKLYKQRYLDGNFVHEASGTSFEFNSDGSFIATEGKAAAKGEQKEDKGKYVVRGNKLLMSDGTQSTDWQLIDEDTIRAGDNNFVLTRK